MVTVILSAEVVKLVTYPVPEYPGIELAIVTPPARTPFSASAVASGVTVWAEEIRKQKKRNKTIAISVLSKVEGIEIVLPKTG
jgi:hypothetical protein